MSTHTTRFSTMLVLVAGVVWAETLITRLAGPGARADQLAAEWEAEYADQGLYAKTPIPLDYSRAFSKHFTKARGTAELNFEAGRVTVSVDGLDPLEPGATYEAWLVDHVLGAGNTAAIDLGEHGDRILNLGALPATGSLVSSVDPKELATWAVDMATVMRVAPGQHPEYVIGGMQSIRHRIGRAAKVEPVVAAAGFAGGQGGGKKVQTLVAQGRDLFFNATFGGNGRTCATCHRADRDLTIDADFIAALPSTDALFVAENDPALRDFDPANPTIPALEDAGPAGLMRTRGLTLENINGFEVNSAGRLLFPPVFRATPSLFNLEFTAPYGLSDCCPDLQTFSAGAVMQHFTRTLNRVPGVDFVVPTAAELRALEAFQLSNRSPANGNFKISGRNSLLSTAADPRATNTTRPEVRGRDLFLSVGCTTCHLGTVFSGGAVNLDTGVEARERTLSNHTPTIDIGDGLGRFQIPQLFGLRKQHFFHTGLLGNNTVLVSGETLRFANLRQAVSFYVSADFAGSPEGQLAIFAAIRALTDQNLDDIAHFLERISGG